MLRSGCQQSFLASVQRRPADKHILEIVIGTLCTFKVIFFLFQLQQFLTLNHLTSAFVLDTSHSKVTFSFSAALISMMGLEIIAGGSVQLTHYPKWSGTMTFVVDRCYTTMTA